MEYEIVEKLSTGTHERKRTTTHVVQGSNNAYGFAKALCGTLPKGRSGGWSSHIEGATVTCVKCRNKLNHTTYWVN